MLNGLLLSLALLLLIPIVVLLFEVFSALLPEQRSPKVPSSHPRVAVLIPAHNEELEIRSTLEQLLPQLNPHDRLVVVADNCTDQTAAIARATGATVIERQDQTRRGKGYALDYGMQFLASEPPDVVVIVDADCSLEAGALAQIARQAMLTQRPVQAVYLMEQPAHPKPKDSVSALAFLVKNWVRPAGLQHWQLPCLLDGTGMAFPWTVLRQASLATGNIVEDMQLGIDLAIAGTPTSLCKTARITGRLPQQEHAAKSQRTRWEHGHLQTLLTQVPRLLKAAIRQGRGDLLAMALDLAIPPLSLLVMLWLATLMITLGAGVVGLSWLPATLTGLGGGLMLLAILTAWASYGRTELPAKALLAIPLYVLWKIPLYFAFLIKPQTRWVRTDRDAVDAQKL